MPPGSADITKLKIAIRAICLGIRSGVDEETSKQKLEKSLKKEKARKEGP